MYRQQLCGWTTPIIYTGWMMTHEWCIYKKINTLITINVFAYNISTAVAYVWMEPCQTNIQKRLTDDSRKDKRMESHRWGEVSPLQLVSGAFKHLSFTVVSTMSPLLSRWSSWHLRILTWSEAMTPWRWEMARWSETRRPSSMCEWLFCPLTVWLWSFRPSIL